MSNLILIRGFEIDIPKTMLQHHITNVVDLEKHLKKLIKKRTNSFRLLVVRTTAPNINDQYKMYITNKYLVKDKNNKEISELWDYKQFFNIKTPRGRYKASIDTFINKVKENQQHVIVKNQDYTVFYDLYEEMYVF
ncbi:hypothetical protein Klosneuvirus_1_327 [Klosneuvirus KNV1]|uniref:Uncharacterized protein n=1 Tax=Klosneuvirus KNV1 TaxID=1977640 RepID=A0A1V0SIC5_9VIRU|nr:hypothetical protein Klosneuvirus_1_327 [Klosneuvirus KNV1]